MAEYVTVDEARVGVLMGSASDWPTMEKTSQTLESLGIAHECNVISAHRAPKRLEAYCSTAEERGLQVLICAAGGAAHLAGVAAAADTLADSWMSNECMVNRRIGFAAFHGADAQGYSGGNIGRWIRWSDQRRHTCSRDHGLVGLDGA